MSPLSKDPVLRERQLANLQRGPRPPAPPPGNVRGLVHGGTARAATLVAAGSWAERIYRELEGEAPMRSADGSLPVHDRQVVELLASALARLQNVEAWLATRPTVDEKGQAWPAEDVAARLRREVAGYLDALGMTPRARAALGVDVARAATFDPLADWQRRRAAPDVDADAQEVS